MCSIAVFVWTPTAIAYQKSLSLTFDAGDLGSSLDSYVCDDCITSSAMADWEEDTTKSAFHGPELG